MGQVEEKLEKVAKDTGKAAEKLADSTLRTIAGGHSAKTARLRLFTAGAIAAVVAVGVIVLLVVTCV